MAKIPFRILSNVTNPEEIIEDVIGSKLVSCYTNENGTTIIARYGVNKSTLKKLLKKEEETNG